MTEHVLDVKRLLCPMPVIKAQALVKTLNAGDIVKVIATDPGAMHDVPSFCRINGHEVLKAIDKEGEYHIHFKIKQS